MHVYSYRQNDRIHKYEEISSYDKNQKNGVTYVVVIAHVPIAVLHFERQTEWKQENLNLR